MKVVYSRRSCLVLFNKVGTGLMHFALFTMIYAPSLATIAFTRRMVDWRWAAVPGEEVKSVVQFLPIPPTAGCGVEE
jgi:hypothetical protein